MNNIIPRQAQFPRPRQQQRNGKTTTCNPTLRMTPKCHINRLEKLLAQPKYVPPRVSMPRILSINVTRKPRPRPVSFFSSVRLDYTRARSHVRVSVIVEIVYRLARILMCHGRWGLLGNETPRCLHHTPHVRARGDV